MPDQWVPPPGTVGTLAQVPRAFALACSPSTIFAGTTDGKLVAAPVDGSAVQEISPAPSGVVGYLAWADDYLFYTLPAEGEVHERNLATGSDIVLATGQQYPNGIAVAGSDVFFVTETGLSNVAKHAANQTPSPRIDFNDDTRPFPRGAGLGLTLSGTRFVVAHAPAPPSTSGSLGMYASTGEMLGHYTFFSKTIGVAASETHTYWSQSDGHLYSGPKLISQGGLQPSYVGSEQVLLGDICALPSHLYFTAVNDQDVREIRYVAIE